MELTKGKINEKKEIKRFLKGEFMNGQNGIKLKIRIVIGYKRNIYNEDFGKEINERGKEKRLFMKKGIFFSRNRGY